MPEDAQLAATAPADEPLSGDGVDAASRAGDESSVDVDLAEVVWTKDWIPQFLESLSKTPVIAFAARAAGVSRQYVYRERDNNPNFAEAWRQALEEALDLGEQELWRRATIGRTRKRSETVEKLDAAGKVVERVVREVEEEEVSDKLLLRALEAHRPQRWRSNFKIESSGPGGGPIPVHHSGLSPVEVAVEEFDSEVRRLTVIEGGRGELGPDPAEGDDERDRAVS